MIYELNKLDEALYIEPHVWRTTFEHSTDAVLVVLSSLEYNEEDYIRDYDKFEQLSYKNQLQSHLATIEMKRIFWR